MDNIQRAIASGFDMGMVAKLLTDGHTPGGLTGTIANGASASPSRMYGVKSANPQLSTPDVVNVTGDDTRLGIFTFDSEESPSFDMSVGEMDMDIIAAVQGTNIYTIASYYDLSLMAPIGREFPDMLLWFVSQAKGRQPGNKGAGYHSLVMPKSTLTYLGRNFEERSEATFNWNVVVNPFDRMPWGGGPIGGSDTFGKAEAFMFEWVTNKRPQILVIKDDTSTNSYTMPYVPWTDGNSNVRFIAWRNGAIVGQTGSTGAVAVAADKTVTLGAGLTSRAAGDTIFIFAEQA